MLSGAMMFDFMGWSEVGAADRRRHRAHHRQKRVTYDLERLMPGATKLKTSEFASAIIENMQAAVGRREPVGLAASSGSRHAR